MQSYKVEVSKNNKKYSIIIKSENEYTARERVHREGYTILALQQVGDNESIGATFVFEGYQNGELKHGKIVGNDIFKAYVKLSRDLGYDIDYLYSEGEKDITIEKKQRIIEELREEYALLYEKKKESNLEKNSKKRMDKDMEFNLESFYLNKELEDTNKLINKVLTKLNDVFEGRTLVKINPNRKEKLKLIYNEIIKLQKSTNISKLKEVGEAALNKIGELELEELEKSKNKEDRNLLKNTNKLLRELGSKTQFIEKERDLKYQFNVLASSIKELFSTPETEKEIKEKKEEIDKDSYTYVKNMLYLNKYKARLSQNTKFIVKNAFSLIFSGNLREETFLKRDVIKQNIVLFEARVDGVSISYTLLTKGLGKIINNIILFFKSLEGPLFMVILLYTLIFVAYFNILPYHSLVPFSFDGLSALIVIILFYLGILISNSLIVLLISFVILALIIIFGVINF